MEDSLAVVINGELTLQYDRAKPLPGQQRAYLDRMDARMDSGFELNGVRIDAPDTAQRAQLVTLHLIDALNSNDEPLASAMCAYLAVRLPELKQVKVNSAGEEVTVDLVFDEPYTKEVRVEFVKPPSKKNGEGGV